MLHKVITELVAYYSRNFFIEPILLLAFIFCSVLGLLYNYGERARVFFLYYFFAGVILFFVASPLEVALILRGRRVDVFNEVANTMFELIEFTAFYHFFRKCLRSESFKKISKLFLASIFLIGVAFFTALLFPVYPTERIREHSFIINVIEFFFLTILCLAYFYELFSSTPKIPLFDRPSFFITTGVFFYAVLLIPFFIVGHGLWKDERSIFNILFSGHYVLLFIVLLTLAKAFLCRKPITI